MSKLHSTLASLVIFLLILNNSHISTCYNFGPAVYQITQPLDHGEGSMWDSRTGLLYFTDAYEGRILSYDLETGSINEIKLNGTVTPVITSKSNPHLLIVGVNRSVYAVEWDGIGKMGATKKLTTVSQQFPNSRFNEGKADKEGRLWFGTLGAESPTGIALNEGALYFITRANLHNPPAILAPVNISNGLAWNRANNKFYHIDTFTFAVKEYDYDNKSGKISNPKVVFDLTRFTNIGGYLDGMTIDRDDNLWIALQYGGAVIKVNPKTGNVLQVVAIPAECISSVSWGGRKLDILFVGTSRRPLSPEEGLKQPAAGSLFAIKYLGTHGLPPNHANIIDRID